jgi:hypothetical protein
MWAGADDCDEVAKCVQPAGSGEYRAGGSRMTKRSAPSEPEMESALRCVVRVAATKSGTCAFYALVLGAIAVTIATGGTVPAILLTLTTNLGFKNLSTVLGRVALGRGVSAEDIRNACVRAIDETGITERLLDPNVWRILIRLDRWQRYHTNALRTLDHDTVAGLREMTEMHQSLADKLDQLSTGVAGVATNVVAMREDLARIWAMLAAPGSETGAAREVIGYLVGRLGWYQEYLGECKELHRLLQGCLSSLIPFKRRLEILQMDPLTPKKAEVVALWAPCQSDITRLKEFATSVRRVDTLLCGEHRGGRGLSWMIEIIQLCEDLESSIQENDLVATYDVLTSLWDEMYDGLAWADDGLHHSIRYLGDLLESVRHGTSQWQAC